VQDHPEEAVVTRVVPDRGYGLNGVHVPRVTAVLLAVHPQIGQTGRYQENYAG
jgi:hypothetical protein